MFSEFVSHFDYVLLAVVVFLVYRFLGEPLRNKV